MRSGPGVRYPIVWEYHRRGLPVKVIGEFDVWRQVEDHDGVSGWMHVQTLSVRRTVMVLDTTVKIHESGDEGASVIAVAERGVLLDLEACFEVWCKIAGDGVSGWLMRGSLWGLLEGEDFK